MEASATSIESLAAPASQGAPIRRRETCLALPGSTSLFCSSWSPPEPERALLLVHGFGEHSLRYDHFGCWLAERGCAVHSFDLRGHGRSTGRRGHVEAFDQYLDDTERMLDRVRAQHPGLRPTLIGHSLGGLVVACVARQRDPDVASVITSGAALAPSPDLSQLKALLAKLLCSVAPRLSMEVGIDPDSLSNDPEVARRYVEDPLVHGRMSARHAAEMLQAVDRVRGGGDRVRVPMLLLHGADDRLCLSEGSESFYSSLPGSGDTTAGEGSGASAPRARLQIYPGMKHEIFNELGHLEVFGDLLRWIVELEEEARPAA